MRLVPESLCFLVLVGAKNFPSSLPKGGWDSVLSLGLTSKNHISLPVYSLCHNETSPSTEQKVQTIPFERIITLSLLFLVIPSLLSKSEK